MVKVRYIDPMKCIGCRACEVACAREHGGEAFVTVYTVEHAELSVPYSCRHCENAPCISVCPTGAMHRSDLGAVVVNPILCIGCRMCQTVCPFGIPVFNRKLKVMVKCDLCIHRIEEGKEPACAATCPAGATFFEEEEKVAEKKRMTGTMKVIEAVERIKMLNHGEGYVARI